jgi:serine/threonine protein kinase
LCRTESGELAKVLDFGLARAVETSLRPALTGAGVIAGTPAYMAPEHLRGGVPSPDWDLWAFAVVAHEAITGALPAAAIGGPDVTPAVAFSSGLGALFARALAPTAFSRPTSAAEFLSELEPLLMAHELPT